MSQERTGRPTAIHYHITLVQAGHTCPAALFARPCDTLTRPILWDTHCIEAAYDEFYKRVWDGVGLLDALQGKQAKTCLEGLYRAIALLKDEHIGQITFPARGESLPVTRNHAAFNLVGLHALAKMYPEATFLVALFLAEARLLTVDWSWPD